VSTLTVAHSRPPDVIEIPLAPRQKRKVRIWAWLLGLWLLSGLYVVATDQQALVTTFGKVTAPRISPGIHYAAPWPIQRVYKLKVHQLRRTVIGGEIPDGVLGRVQPISSEFLSGDLNLMNIRVVAQYSVSDPALFLFQIEDVDRTVASAVSAELSRKLAHTTVDETLTTEKIAIQNDVMLSAQRSLDAYRAGVSVSSINIENVAPPAEAAEAFRGVASAKADAIRIVNEAEGYANDLLPRTRGEATQMMEQAQAYKEGKTNRARGDAARFESVAREYAKAPKVTSTRAYLEAMEQILPKLKKLVVDSTGSLDLTIVRKDDGSTAPLGAQK
jgi:modulator of FtsH protease HflK